MILRTLLLLAVTCAGALRVQPLVHAAPRAAATEVRMMGNNAPEGPFTPLVLAGVTPLVRDFAKRSYYRLRYRHICSCVFPAFQSGAFEIIFVRVLSID